MLLPLQREDFVGIFRAMSGLPVTVRLLDPPLHEFLPNQVELAVEVALGEERGEDVAEQKRVLQKVNELHEANPMLGLRGVRLGIVKPGLYAMQVRAICEAAARVKKEGLDPRVEIMIPLVATAPELSQMLDELKPVAADVLRTRGVELEHLEWGTMIELPRAAVTAGEIAETADFFSFGTNDLTQTAFGFSRDDIGKFVGMYEERKLVPANPFVTVDVTGRRTPDVDRRARRARPRTRILHLGICGEHGGDPASVVFCHQIGLDYVSCSPFRVETARLAAGQAAVGEVRVRLEVITEWGTSTSSGAYLAVEQMGERATSWRRSTTRSGIVSSTGDVGAFRHVWRGRLSDRPSVGVRPMARGDRCGGVVLRRECVGGCHRRARRARPARPVT